MYKVRNFRITVSQEFLVHLGCSRRTVLYNNHVGGEARKSGHCIRMTFVFYLGYMIQFRQYV